MKLLSRLKRFFTTSNFYHCPHCGYKMPKDDATVSGWDSQQSSCHIHCPNCGKIIKHLS